MPFPFIRSKKLEGNRKTFQSRQSLNILRLRSGSIERPMQNYTGKACADLGELKTFALARMSNFSRRAFSHHALLSKQSGNRCTLK